MSYRNQRTLSLAGVDVSGLPVEDLRSLVREILAAGIHGLCFSPYVEGQGPGTEVDERQIRDRLAVIQPFARWVRSFSASEGNELIPAIAKDHGLQTMVGVWIGDDLDEKVKQFGSLFNTVAIHSTAMYTIK